MKNLVFIFVLLTAFAKGQIFAQTFTAETGYMYLGEKNTERVGGMEIKSGGKKKNDKIDIYAPTGRKFTATITKITNKENEEIKEVKAGEYGFFTFEFTEDPSTGNDYVTNGYKVYPSGFKADTAILQKEAEEKVSASVNFNATLDGKPFRGKVTYKGALFLRKGVKNYIDKPFLQLQFASVDNPDTRILSIQVFDPKESPAKYTAKDMEVSFSGAADGNTANTTMFGFVNGKATPNFELEITKWQRSGNKITISGTIKGELPEVKLLGRSTKVNRFENGTFEDIEVEVIEEQGDMKEMIKKAGG